MSNVYAISRIQSYKFSDVGGVLKEALRTLPNYDNPNCDPNRSYLNVNLIDTDLCGLSPEKYILKFREDNGIKGRFNTNAKNPKSNTNCMCQALFTASNEYMAQFTRDEQIQYFEDCLEFFKGEFPSVFIIAANCHFDEVTPHLHISFIPTISRINKKSNEPEIIFSTSKLMPGKDFFPKYQDRFYKYISSKYDGLDRGHSDRKNMSVKQFKEYTRLRNEYLSVCDELADCKKALSESKKNMSYLYTELLKLQQEKSKFESIPLFGFLFSIIAEMRAEQQERMIKQFIKLAEKEQRSLDSLIDDAELKKSHYSNNNKTVQKYR